MQRHDAFFQPDGAEVSASAITTTVLSVQELLTVAGGASDVASISVEAQMATMLGGGWGTERPNPPIAGSGLD